MLTIKENKLDIRNTQIRNTQRTITTYINLNPFYDLNMWFNVNLNKNNVKMEFEYPIDDFEFSDLYSFFVYRNLKNNLLCSKLFKFVDEPVSFKTKKLYDYKNFLVKKPEFNIYCKVLSEETYKLSENNSLKIQIFNIEKYAKSKAYYLVYLEREMYLEDQKKFVGRSALLEIINHNNVEKIEDYLNNI